MYPCVEKIKAHHISVIQPFQEANISFYNQKVEEKLKEDQGRT